MDSNNSSNPVATTQDIMIKELIDHLENFMAKDNSKLYFDFLMGIIFDAVA